MTADRRGRSRMVRVKGSGTFCHWGVGFERNAASGKRLPTPLNDAMRPRFAEPGAEAEGRHD